jgi:DNA-binding CsgD family transcriptional regulator
MEKTLSNALEALIRFWEKSSEPWAVKDNQSRYIYANHQVKRIYNLPDSYCLEGLREGEVPAPTAAFAQDFERRDRQTELLQDRTAAIDIQLYCGLSYCTPRFFEKYPLIDENGVSQGIIDYSRPVPDITLIRLNKVIKVPTSLVFTPPSALFTKREWEVLFYILHDFSSNEIAKKIHLSSRSVCNITQNIYRKAGVTSKPQIVEYCYENKINNYVPQSFFEYPGSFPLAG